MSDLIIPAGTPAGDGRVTVVTPASAGWDHVGFEVLRLAPGQVAQRDTQERECCVVVISGGADVRSAHGDWRGLGRRATPFAGEPDAAYLPPRCPFSVSGAAQGGEVALCFAPAEEGAAPRVLPASGIRPEVRGHGNQQRIVNAILMGDQAAEALLVCEVHTPAGHWSSYPPHRHDHDALPGESRLEETYYFRIDPPRGFALQRVYTDDRSIDETMTVCDGDTVLVPRGYHTVSAPPGYTAYYLNVMAGPARAWAVTNDPDHEWTLDP